VPSAQLDLPLDSTPRLRRGQVVEPRAETDELYRAVMSLRCTARTVYCAGADHQVDGRLLSTRQLVVLAHSVTPAPLAPTSKREEP
jgi:hypothetical protein